MLINDDRPVVSPRRLFVFQRKKFLDQLLVLDDRRVTHRLRVLELLIVERQDRTELRGQHLEEEQIDRIVLNVRRPVLRRTPSGQRDRQDFFLVLPNQFEVFENVQRRQRDLTGQHLGEKLFGVLDRLFVVVVVVELLRLPSVGQALLIDFQLFVRHAL